MEKEEMDKENANRRLLKSYQDKLSIQIKTMKRKANKDTIMELSRLRYIVSKLENNKNINVEQLEDESIRYANEVISAGNKLASILGITPLD